MKTIKCLLLFLFVCNSPKFLRSQATVYNQTQIIKEYKSALALYKRINQFATEPGYSEKKELELNKQLLQQVRHVYSNIPKDAYYDTIRFHSSYMIGELEHYFENYPEAFTFYQRAIVHATKSHLPDSLIFRPRIYSGIILYQQGRIDEAAEEFYKAERIKQKYDRPLQEVERLYNTLGVLNFETGNYRLAKNYFLQSIDLLRPSNLYYTDLLVNYKVNLAHMHYKLEEFNEALKIYGELLKQDKNINDINQNIGLVYLAQDNATRALSYFEKVKYNDYRNIRLYSNIAKAYLQLKAFDSAQNYLHRALSMDKNHDRTGYGLALKSFADYKMAMNKPQEALPYYDSAIQIFYPGFKPSTNTRIPLTYSGYLSYIPLYDALIGRAASTNKLFKQFRNINWGVEELKAYQSAFNLIEHVEQTYNNDEARLFINRIKYRAHSNPIDIAYQLYKRTGNKSFLDALYVIDQQNKASVLALNQNSNGIATGSFGQIQNEERKLKTAITRLSLKAAQLNNENEVSKINREISTLEIELSRLHNNENQRSPFHKSIPSINTLQKELLDDHTAIVSYHLSEHSLTILVISRKEVNCIQTPLPSNFKQILNKYTRQLHEPLSTMYPPDGNKIYKWLLAPVDHLEVEHLIVIPDDELIYLPFEALKDEKQIYAVQKFSIQYQYSTAILNKEVNNFAGKPILSLAPFISKQFETNASFSNLPYSKEEIKDLKGKQFEGAKATRKAFLDNVGNFSIVHLATHAVAGNATGESFVVFKGKEGIELLHTEEIYNVSLPKTKLLVLSACETGTGELVRGEGVMSISRAFTYAGCSNIITTLWKTNDFSTAYITKRIHHYLDKNYTIEQAARKAKLDYLSDESINPRLKHPYYWSHLIFIGNLQESPINYWPIAGFTAIIILLIGIAYLITKGRKKSANNNLTQL